MRYTERHTHGGCPASCDSVLCFFALVAAYSTANSVADNPTLDRIAIARASMGKNQNSTLRASRKFQRKDNMQRQSAGKVPWGWGGGVATSPIVVIGKTSTLYQRKSINSPPQKDQPKQPVVTDPKVDPKLSELIDSDLERVKSEHSEMTETNVILSLPSGERQAFLRNDKALVKAVANAVGLNADEINVHYEGNLIEPGLTTIDCCVAPNSRLTVTRITKGLDVILCLPSGERMVRICQEGLVEAVAYAVGLPSAEINVHYEDSFIGPGLTLQDCCVVRNARLAVSMIGKMPIDIESLIAEALPLLTEAMNAIAGITRTDINELRSVMCPPRLVSLTIATVAILFGLEPDKQRLRQSWDPYGYWFAWQRFSTKPVLDEIRCYEKDNIPQAAVIKVRRVLKEEGFTHERVSCVSSACARLFMWVVSMVNYHDFSRRIQVAKAHNSNLL